MKTLLVPQVALAALALVPTLLGQDPGGHTGLVEFTRPATAPRVRVAQADEPQKLGVMVSETDDGVLISDVFDDSLADRAGLADGDILFKIGGQRVDVVGDIPEALSAASQGDTVSITVIRPGEGLVTLHGKQSAPEQIAEDFPFTPAAHGGFLGVELSESDSGGVHIDGVIDGTAAWFAGLESGDVLLAINGERVHAAGDVAQAIGAHEAGDTVKLVYTRGGEKRSTNVRLGHRTPQIRNPQGNFLFEGFPGGEGDAPHAMFFGKEGFSGDGFDWEELTEELEGLGEWSDDSKHQLRFKFDGNGPHGVHGLDLEALEGLHDIKIDLKGLEGLKVLHTIEGLDLEDLMDGSAHQLEIKIEDGVMTIDRDGELEVIELDGDHAFMEDIGFFSPGTHGAQILSGAGSAECSEKAAECDAQAAACDAVVSTVTSEVSCCASEVAATQVKLVAISSDAAECQVKLVECSADTAECQADLAECHELIANVSAVTAECAEAAAECAVAVGDCEQVAAECAVEAAECQGLATEVSFITAETVSASAACADAATECAEAAAECAEAAEACCSEETAAESEDSDADSVS